MIEYKYNKDKAVNSILYIAQRIADPSGRADKYAALKILYFAETKHLAEYGRLITDDDFAALPFGPVPSHTFDLLKPHNVDSNNFEVLSSTKFIPVGKVDDDLFSESDLECLDLAIKENKELGFSALKDKSHDEAYHKARKAGNLFLKIEDIVLQSKVSSDILSYIKEHYDGLKLSKCP